MAYNKMLVLQTDFGLVDGAVSAMHGVAHTVASDIQVSDLTHEIPPYDIWNASYRLYQTIKYWPADTVFVSVVDPGVGSARRSIAVKTKSGHYVITPDNGTLTHIYKYEGVEAVRVIDENKNRLPHSQESNTFHGRDVYAYNGALLASGQVAFEELGEDVPVDSLVTLPVIGSSPARRHGRFRGTIDVLDVRFGSLWTNIPLEMVKELSIDRGDSLLVTILHQNVAVYQEQIPFVRSFAEVNLGQPLVYINSLVNIGIALNQESFAAVHHIGIGTDWQVKISKVNK